MPHRPSISGRIGRQPRAGSVRVMTAPHAAPELDAVEWVNSEPLTLAGLRGRVVLVEAFQMLCPACVTHGLPQAKRVHEMFRADDLAVIGLHSVFEHHEAMTPVALRAFLAEFRYRFPVAIDRPAERGSIPSTMRRYDLQGTPSQILIDREGRIRSQTFGIVDDLALGAQLGRLLAEPAPPAPTSSGPSDRFDGLRDVTP